jgi:hypothetical protein
VVVLQSQANLLQIVLALRSLSGLADLLDRWQQQPDENRDNRDYHQELDQRKS